MHVLVQCAFYGQLALFVLTVVMIVLTIVGRRVMLTLVIYRGRMLEGKVRYPRDAWWCSLVLGRPSNGTGGTSVWWWWRGLFGVVLQVGGYGLSS